MKAVAGLSGSVLPGALIVLMCPSRCWCPACAGVPLPPAAVLVSYCSSPSPPASFVTTLCLQGHSRPVTCLDFSSNGKYLASCSEDRTVRLWSTRDLAGREHRCLRASMGLDHAELVRLSPDSRPPVLRPSSGGISGVALGWVEAASLTGSSRYH
ncbi:probable cytosolic iron-sulfur protein assembly protein CIAO1 homolog [Geospiza fortis]|uniref:Probable cytosolic iron-sulfur protein assembly protein CIAO1 homolog n=1 Tax=Geospiza fortis TaxID=48883 RepID=A0A8N5HU41_GEOFO|nr:probable cytosolic iron-sulfur protein assembly protein CIAO1 homolog [Geospiza fortis]